MTEEDNDMFHVYSKNLKTGKEDFITTCDSPEAAVRKIASCYALDRAYDQLGEYYYFMKQR